MKRPDPFLSDDWKNIPLITREVRLDADGTAWIGPCDPVMREGIREVYRKLCEEGESGRQLVAVHQEVIAELIALIRKKKRRAVGAKKRARRAGRQA